MKDRLALSVVLDAEARGELKPDATIVECTSGNVDVALAMVAAARGHQSVAVMGQYRSRDHRRRQRLDQQLEVLGNDLPVPVALRPHRGVETEQPDDIEMIHVFLHERHRRWGPR